MKVFLTGAAGSVGRHVLRRLLRDGHAEMAAVRSAESSRQLQARGLPVPPLSIPAGAAWMSACVVEGAWQRLGQQTEPPLTREAVRLLGYAFTLDTRRSHRLPGYRPVVTVDQGLQLLRPRAGPGAALPGTSHRAEVN
jgi:nucleoside-diphosphate-sugar epimerase